MKMKIPDLITHEAQTPRVKTPDLKTHGVKAGETKTQSTLDETASVGGLPSR